MKLKLIPLLLLFMFSLSAQEEYAITDSALYKKALKLSKDILIIDTHNDLPIAMRDNWFDVSVRSDKNMDYESAMSGGVDVVFMSIFTWGGLEGTGRAKSIADSLIDVVNKIVTTWPEKFSLVTATSELNKNKQGKLLLPMGMENGSPIEGNLENLKYFYNKGIRYLTLTHTSSNHIGDSANDTLRKWNGLSPFGEDIIKEMNKLGMIIDISHVSDSTFYDVLKLSKAPVIASHSCCRFFTPGNERNMSDKMIKLLAKKKGIIQITLIGEYLREDIYKARHTVDLEIKKYFDSTKVDPRIPEGRLWTRNFRKEHPIKKATVKDVADHIDHVVKLVGVDYVGVGSDFYGAGDDLPIGLENASKFPNLIYELLSRGYSNSQIKKIMGENFLRVWKAVESKRIK